MKIAVIGNCQHGLVGQCLQMMLPRTTVRLFGSNDIPNDALRDDPAIAASDLVLIQPGQQHEILKSSLGAEKLRLYPRITWEPHYPDFVVAHKTGGGLHDSPLGQWHSAIVVWAFNTGLTPGQALGLFADEAFADLGYYETGRLALSLQAELKACGLSESLLDGWRARGAFMHASVHPKMFVLADVARALVGTLGAGAPVVDNPEDYLADYLASSVIWPIYPDVARRYGLNGDYVFKTTRKDDGSHITFEALDLEQFVERSFAMYRGHGQQLLLQPHVAAACEKLARHVKGPVPRRAPQGDAAVRAASPYAGLSDDRYWRRAVAGPAPEDVDPVASGGFAIGPGEAIATAGSCFAQHIARRIVESGFNYLVAEAPPAGTPAAEAARRNFGVFSARYGNVYTAKQLEQLFDRAYGSFKPYDRAWRRPDGRYVDPFRPAVEPDGFAGPDEVEADRAVHLASVRTMFETLDVFVFTLGLTEAWRSKVDGAVFPLAPGVSGGEFEPELYAFENFLPGDVTRHLQQFVKKLRRVNPRSRIILTVSPVPLIATYEPRHVLVSTAVSKATLRVAADKVERLADNVSYFPSYEIVTGAHARGRYFEDDLRSVTPEGVSHVMRLFEKHYLSAAEAPAARPSPAAADYGEIFDIAGIVCDEEDMARAHGG